MEKATFSQKKVLVFHERIVINNRKYKEIGEFKVGNLPNVSEWLNLLLRWVHIVAGISWIGSSFYFMWLDSHLTKPTQNKENVSGELWMVHSGGFYQVEKRLIVPGQMPPVLHWFKWEAFFTWLSGFCLLMVVYYLGSGAYLTDPSVSPITAGQAKMIGVGLLVVAWFIYDGLYNSPLAKNSFVSTCISLFLLAGVAFGLSRLFSGRAAYIHVGAMLGTLMVANVWVRILPAQRQMIAATDRGSVHNNYMTFPVIFIMISNHFPNTYGNRFNWLVLMGLVLASAGVRYTMNKRTTLSRWVLVPATAVLAGVFVMTSHHTSSNSSETPFTQNTESSNLVVVDQANAGKIQGIVKLMGPEPAPTKDPIGFPAGCAEQHAGPVYMNSIKARDHKIENAFVAITGGFEGKSFPLPTDDIIIDQKGCLYNPIVVGARVGQKVIFVNSDPVFHNVRSLAEKNPLFNDGMQNKGEKLIKVFSVPELMVHAHCDVHPWMNTFIGVVDNPYYATTGTDGTFEIKNIPPGTYQVTVWQELLGTQTKQIIVKSQETTRADFEMGPAK